MANTAIVGINWGDEGKGRMVDLLTEEYDIVVRYQGGGNAGHTVINEYGKFALHLLPSDIFRKGVINILGNGVALDPENLWKEIEDVRSKGVSITPDNLKISDRASLLLPWHRELRTIERYAMRINGILQEFWAACGVTLVDFKMEFGRLADGSIVLADEISPDTCRLWDSNTHEKLDKDRFRRDLGGVEEAYAEIMRRLEEHL